MSRRPPEVNVRHHATVADAETDVEVDAGSRTSPDRISSPQHSHIDFEGGAGENYGDQFVVPPPNRPIERRTDRNASSRLRHADRTSTRDRENISSNTRAERPWGSMGAGTAWMPPPMMAPSYEYPTIPEEGPPDDYYAPNVLPHGRPGFHAAPLVRYRRNSRQTPAPAMPYGRPYDMPHPGYYTSYPNFRPPVPPPPFPRNNTAQWPGQHGESYGPPSPLMSPGSLSPVPTQTPPPTQSEDYQELREGLGGARLRAEAAAAARVEGRLEAEKRERWKNQARRDAEVQARRDAEVAMQRRFDDMIRVQEQTKREIEIARREAEEAAMRRMEEERKRAEEEARMLQEQRLRMERDVRGRFEAEQKAKEEARQAEAERLEEMMRQAKERVQLEMEAERKKVRDMEEERERMRAEIRAEIQAEEDRRRRRAQEAQAAARAITPLPPHMGAPRRHIGMGTVRPGRAPGQRPRPRRPPSVPEPPRASADEEFVARSESERSDTESGVYSPHEEADSPDGSHSRSRSRSRSSSGSDIWRVRERRELRLIREELVDPIVYALSGGWGPRPVFMRRPPSSHMRDEFPPHPFHDEMSDWASGDDDTVTQRSYRPVGRPPKSQRVFRRPSRPRMPDRVSDDRWRAPRRLSRVLASERLSGEGLLHQEDREELSPHEEKGSPSQEDVKEVSPQEDGSNLAMLDEIAAEEVAPRPAGSTAAVHRITEDNPTEKDGDAEESAEISSEVTDDTVVGDEPIAYAPDPPDSNAEMDSGYDGSAVDEPYDKDECVRY
ncbi:hypothetical protein N431DRAFT_223943 [Stipitochalara longipes BDJ]|nr:hypothetical protein N431DRAFT_223943 [Stipitochalara longipes BDJ]